MNAFTLKKKLLIIILLYYILFLFFRLQIFYSFNYIIPYKNILQKKDYIPRFLIKIIAYNMSYVTLSAHEFVVVSKSEFNIFYYNTTHLKYTRITISKTFNLISSSFFFLKKKNSFYIYELCGKHFKNILNNST